MPAVKQSESDMIAGARPGTVRVLIIEDEPRLRELLADEITEMGFIPSPARSAEDALRLLNAESFGIAVLDLQLPLMNGMDLFELIRTRWPNLQVIVLTGYGDLDAARRAIRLDVVDFLTKPCPLQDLEQALERARRRLPGEAILDPIDLSIDLPVEPFTAESSAEAQITLADAEREQIIAALKRADGNRTVAAAALGISRRTLHYRLNEYRQQGYEIGDV